MITTLIREMDVTEAGAGEGAVEDEAQCRRCDAEAPGGEDNARDNEDWVLTDDGELLCGFCREDAEYGPSGFYDPAYFG